MKRIIIEVEDNLLPEVEPIVREHLADFFQEEIDAGRVKITTE